MSQRYERVWNPPSVSLTSKPSYITLQINNQEDPDAPSTPNSPPPSFHSRASSLHRQNQPLISDEDRTLADTFDTPSDDEDDNEDSSHHQLDDRQRVMSGRPNNSSSPSSPASPDARPGVVRQVTQLPVFPSTTSRPQSQNAPVNDGVFANLNAKPSRHDSETELDEKPPSYEQAAADATPPYWETTILTPSGAASDNDVFIDGLPVGTFFSFVWNAMISMSFQLVGFLLTYLLHTTHAAKNGSKAGLGITLIQYGFSMKRDFSGSNPPDQKPGEPGAPPDPNMPGDAFVPPPNDPNNHDFDPNAAIGSSAFVADAQAAASGAGGVVSGMRASDWFAYALMVVGWFILIRAISQYFKARRHEQLVLQSPSRGLGVPVVAEGEGEQAA